MKKLVIYNATFSDKFARNWNPNHRILESDLIGVDGMPVAVAWDSHGEIEEIKFEDDSTYVNSSR